MLDLIVKIYKSPGFKIFLRVLASLASAVFVVTGFIFLQGKRQSPELKDDEDPDDEDDTPPQGKVHFLNKQ